MFFLLYTKNGFICLNILDRYHNGITGPRGEVDVVGVGGDAPVPLLYVACHILTDAFNPLAGTVGPFKNNTLNFSPNSPNQLILFHRPGSSLTYAVASAGV